MTPSGSLRSTASRTVEPALSSPQSQHVRRCVPRGLTARLASPLPTHLLRICAGALYRRAQCAVSKFASGQSHTVALPRKHLLTPREEPRRLTFLLLSKILPRGGFPSASSQRSKLCKPLRSSRLCSDARCSSSRKTRCAIFAGALFLNILLQAKPRFCAAGLNLRHTWRLLYNKDKTAGGR